MDQTQNDNKKKRTGNKTRRTNLLPSFLPQFDNPPTCLKKRKLCKHKRGKLYHNVLKKNASQISIRTQFMAVKEKIGLSYYTFYPIKQK